MVKVNLMPNESIILKSKNVMHGGLMANYTDELILTNQNIIHVKKGVFGNTKNVKKYPLNQIKIFNGKSQAILGKQRNGSP
ncbi:PH domain-containing protein [Planococcus koreensis]|uniref:PH domain-containing protein n=2 Tax=Planococcus TaxID=1372 RepID=UPI0039FD0337